MLLANWRRSWCLLSKWNSPHECLLSTPCDNVPLCSSFHQVIAGILASSDDGKFRTDGSWKCTTGYVENWMLTSFDDRSWPKAAVAGENSDTDIHRNMKDIHSSAKWIWTGNFKGATADSTVYCRGYIGKLWMCVCVRYLQRSFTGN